MFLTMLSSIRVGWRRRIWIHQRMFQSWSRIWVLQQSAELKENMSSPAISRVEGEYEFVRNKPSWRRLWIHHRMFLPFLYPSTGAGNIEVIGVWLKKEVIYLCYPAAGTKKKNMNSSVYIYIYTCLLMLTNSRDEEEYEFISVWFWLYYPAAGMKKNVNSALYVSAFAIRQQEWGILNSSASGLFNVIYLCYPAEEMKKSMNSSAYVSDYAIQHQWWRRIWIHQRIYIYIYIIIYIYIYIYVCVCVCLLMRTTSRDGRRLEHHAVPGSAYDPE